MINVLEQINQTRIWSEDEKLLLDQVERMVREVLVPNAEK